LWAAAAVALVVVAAASGSTLPPPLLEMADQGTALAGSGARVAAAATCDVRVADVGKKPRLLKRYGFCREDRFESATIGLWLGKNTVVEENILSPSPHGDGYELWVGPPGGALYQSGDEWGWTDSDPDNPTYGCDRMIGAGGGVVAISPVANNLGDGTSCTAHTSTPLVLKGAVDRKLTVPGAWGAIATNGKRVALVGFDSSGNRTGELAVIGVDGQRLAAPHVAKADVRSAAQGWFTPVGLFLDSKRGLVAPGGQVLVKRYAAITIGEGRAVYVRGRQLRARRLKGGPDKLVLKLPFSDSYVAAGSPGVAVLVGTVSSHSAVYRIPWRTIDAVVPR
jgi:hypothetical protein